MVRVYSCALYNQDTGKNYLLGQIHLVLQLLFVHCIRFPQHSLGQLRREKTHILVISTCEVLWSEPWFVTPSSDVGDGDGALEEATQSHGNTEDLTTLVCVRGVTKIK